MKELREKLALQKRSYSVYIAYGYSSEQLNWLSLEIIKTQDKIIKELS
jgi:hypothetical protein